MDNVSKESVDVDYKIDLSGDEPKVEATAETKTEETATEETVEQTEETVEQTTVETSTEEEVEAEPQQKSKEELFNELLRDKFNMDETELQNVLSQEKETQELPEEIEKYLQYKKETNRSLQDYMKLQEDLSTIDNATLLREFYKQTKPGLDDSDITALLDLKFGYDEGAEDSIVKSKTLEMKEEVFKAKQHFEAQREKYRAPLESSDSSSFQEQKEAVEFFKRYKDEEAANRKRQENVRKTFEEKTNKFFNDEFKGFEFKIGEEKVVFKPKDIESTKQSQQDLSNFITKHTDSNGNLIDAQKYHTALSMALNPEAYAKFFYEQGKASAINSVVAEGKNIDMSVRSNVETSSKGPKFRVVEDTPYMSGLKVKKR
jgi:hypothetical protein